MPPRFRTRTASPQASDSPERLFDELPRQPGGADALWAHQADVLRTYAGSHLTTADVAMELPTGAGKTLPGLLIGEWRRRSKNGRVAYACPTQQLARQTAEAATRAGITTVTLVGDHDSWATADKVAYESAGAIALTTYSTVFNVRPHLEPAQTLIFDDAHLGEQYVANAWSADVSRSKYPDVYRTLLGILRPALSGIAYQRLTGEDRTRHTVHLIGVHHVQRLAGDLSAALQDLGMGHQLYWRGAALGDRLDRCLVYVAENGILIRPITPPTAGHRHFTEPGQRLYLSATLGEGGELERAFGRAPIARLAIPDGWDSRGAGRRFFIFPELQNAVPARQLAADVIAAAGKALVLAPSLRAAQAAHDLALNGSPVLGPAGHVDTLLENFRHAAGGLLTLASRYDGLDLPNDECRVTVLDGMPSGAHLQERFISETLQSGRVLRERQRTRVLQGAGRCTRGLSDHSIVIVLGDIATRFFALPDVHDALRPEVQAEVDFGIDNSKAPSTEILDFARSFLSQDRHWRDQAEPELIEARKTARRTGPVENPELAAAAAHEVKATAALWTGDWAAASKAAVAVADEIRSPSLNGYRALWLYLAAAWLHQEADSHDDPILRSAAAALLRKAHAAARHTQWLREISPLPAGEQVLDDLDDTAARRAAEIGPRHTAGNKWAVIHTGLLAALEQTEAARYEGGLAQLGKLLGAESYKPTGNGRTDAAWVWPGQWWLAIEAKSNEKADALVSHRTVREANDQLATLALDRTEPIPDDSAVIIVSPRQLVDPTAAAVAEPFLHLASPASILELARDAVNAWKQIRAQANGLPEGDALTLVRRVLADHGVLPSGIRARLLNDPIQG